MTLLFWIITLIYVLIVLATTTTVLLDNRTPAKTAAWILVLVFLPVIGIILYFFFGQNTRRERYISEHSTDMLTKRSLLEFTEQKNLHIPEEQEVLIKQFALQNWALPFKNNEIEVFTDGYSFFGKLLHDILSATQSIHIVTYIFEDDSLGNLIADALIDKAKHFHPTVLITYEPVLDRIEPKYLDELAQTFGPENTWVVIGREIGNAAGRVEFEFGFVKDLIDKCLELGIPQKF